MLMSFLLNFYHDQPPWLAHLTVLQSVCSLMLTYGVAGRGEWCDGSVRGRVELLLDFGADNPGKVNNRHGSINTASRAWRFHTGPAAPGHLNMAHHVHLHLCMYKCTIVWGACILIFGLLSQIANLWALGQSLCSCVRLNRSCPLRLWIQSSWILRLEIW